MTGAWYDDDWVEDLESWEELAELLRGDWDRVHHPPLGLSLERADGLLAFDLRGRWHARHRRGLHRLGFRTDRHRGIWTWDVEPALRTTDLSLFASPFESIFEVEPSAAGAARVLRMRTSLACDHLVREQALRVLQEVFRIEPSDLEVLLVREDDEGEDAAGPLTDGRATGLGPGAGGRSTVGFVIDTVQPPLLGIEQHRRDRGRDGVEPRVTPGRCCVARL